MLIAIHSRVLSVLLLAAGAAALSDPPLSTADIIRSLRAGISEGTVISEIQERGFWATLDPASEAFLRGAGASDALVSAIRRAAPGSRGAGAPSASPTPSRPGEERPPVPVVGGSGSRPTFAAAARTVRVPVSVLDKNGQPVMGLAGASFKVSENGKKQAVTLFSSEREPMRIALALDVSGSMENKIAQVEEALKHFIGILEPKDEILVLTFNRQVRVLHDFTSDRERLANVLTMLEPTGGTALYDAAYEAIRRVARAPAESKAVVLVSDGVNTVSATTFDRLLALAQRSEVPVFSIGLDGAAPSRDLARSGPPGGGAGGRGRPPGLFGRTRFDAKALKTLADETGGRAEIIKGLEHYTPGEDLPGGDRLRKAVESIALTLRHRYLVGYEPPEGAPGWRTIRIEVDSKTKSTTRARKGYFAEK